MRENRFEEWLLGELWRAYETARKGKRYTVDEHTFELNAMENILTLRKAIILRRYKPSRGVAFIVRDPVIREIVAAPFRDRVVHHFLYNVCAEWWDRRMDQDSYSCRKGKGTLYAQQRLQRHIRQAEVESPSGRAFVAKLDLQGYFMSLEHQRLFRRVVWGLDQQFYHARKPDRENGISCATEDRDELYKIVKYLWREVIFDRPMEDIRIRGSKSEWKDLPKSKSLFCQPEGRGIVIGNLTSQLLSNIYMDQFDRFVKFDLRYKHYGRYVDDFFVVVPMERKDQLLRDVKVMEKYLWEELRLVLHPKKRYFQDAKAGVPFVGAVVYDRFRVPGKRIRRNYYQAAYEMATMGSGEVEELVARMGCIKHLNSRKFLRELYDEFGWRMEE